MRYIKIILEQCKLSVMSAAMYRTNFWLMLVQSIINSFMSVLCIDFIYNSVESIVGWNRNEMIILICTSSVVNQIFRGCIHFNQNRFVSGVGSGGFDRLLLRPVSLMFQVNTGHVDISCIVSALAPLIILIIQISMRGIVITAGQIALFILFVFNGVLVLSSFMLLLYTLAFLYIKVDGLNNIYYFMMDIADRPKEMFGKEFLYGFIFIIPAIPIANAPASILLGKSSPQQMLIYAGVGAMFFLLSHLGLKMGLKRYTSASS